MISPVAAAFETLGVGAFHHADADQRAFDLAEHAGRALHGALRLARRIFLPNFWMIATIIGAKKTMNRVSFQLSAKASAKAIAALIGSWMLWPRTVLKPSCRPVAILHQPAGDIAGALEAEEAHGHVQHAIVKPPADVIDRQDGGLVGVIFLDVIAVALPDQGDQNDKGQHHRHGSNWFCGQ